MQPPAGGRREKNRAGQRPGRPTSPKRARPARPPAGGPQGRGAANDTRAEAQARGRAARGRGPQPRSGGEPARTPEQQGRPRQRSDEERPRAAPLRARVHLGALPCKRRGRPEQDGIGLLRLPSEALRADGNPAAAAASRLLAAMGGYKPTCRPGEGRQHDQPREPAPARASWAGGCCATHRPPTIETRCRDLPCWQRRTSQRERMERSGIRDHGTGQPHAPAYWRGAGRKVTALGCGATAPRASRPEPPQASEGARAIFPARCEHRIDARMRDAASAARAVTYT